MEFEPFGVSPWLAQLSDSAVEYWHANRTAIILAALTILIVLRLYFHFTEGTEPLHVFPKIYDAEDKPVKVEEKVEVVTRNKPDGPRRIKGELAKRRSTEVDTGRRQIKTLIFYSSLTGNTEKTAKEFVKTLAGLLEGVTTSSTCAFSQPEALDLAELDLDEYFITPPKLEEQEDVTTDLFYLFLLPSYNIDSINDTFLEHLNETHNDFRIDTAPLAPILGYSVFGFGDKEGWPTEEAGYCFQAKELDRWLAKLTGRKRAYPLGMGDVKSNGTQRLSEWTNGLLDVLGQLARDGTLGDGVPGSGDAAESDDEADVDDDDGEVVFEDDSQPKSTKPKSSGTLEDLEDLGRILQNAKDDGAKPAAPLAIDFTTTTSKRKQPVQAVKEMVPKNSPTYNSLTKQGYSIIKMMRGVPGVRAERFAEAMRIRHCALSLVGEPIFYPHINEFLEMLHGDRISSFLVCNAQHPDQLAALNHVTQLYVSIDASNKESLRKIDRPLHRDFWERFQRCLEILREKRFKQRTVFRLTLVKGFNIEDEAKGYADLVEKSLPCFVEVKGVTYCGTSTSSSAGLSMANVPFYEEVCEFVTALERELKRRGLNYGIAAEHAHSCCILLGSERFKVDGKWRTQIDYDRFFDLLEERGPDGDFTPEDYMGAETPEWATWGNGGFDPRDQRVDRKGRPIER
ncbi:S-adenosyl-L-methionine-dependent tRNA 4-demethylwyosine synthase [Cytospora mali]|uniref:tRNA 4-demethylwyosine synthase (AdoMet-dependent) n=1 Tax=Cytospora mali TaxID=578113 RepID=A0A194USV6_CYTMA|nr:S-adenosyl-L-methionine-dependent tRNA 4-demethylwyosine synthase [Valsa mali var. pyri (nom. inval.)]